MVKDDMTLTEIVNVIEKGIVENDVKLEMLRQNYKKIGEKIHNLEITGKRLMEVWLKEKHKFWDMEQENKRVKKEIIDVKKLNERIKQINKELIDVRPKNKT